MKQLLLGVVALIGFAGAITPQYAQADCGVIIRAYDDFAEEEPIEDCGNPFEATDSNQYPNTLVIDDVEIESGATIATAPLQAFDLVIESEFFYRSANVYQHEGEDYIQVGEGFLEAPFSLSLATGTYSMVVETSFSPPVLGQSDRSWLAELFLPVAHAQFNDSAFQIEVFIFTVEEVPPVPTGASSVLFLPGFQASRLYRDSNIGIEKLWEPNFIFEDSDVRKLGMAEDGTSIEEIFTKDIIDVAGGDSIYGEFVSFLDSLKTDADINDYAAYAYDWRFDVYDIVENGSEYEDEVVHALDLFDELVATSYTGKVTIIGHSNGGLLGKALIEKIDFEGRADEIDQFIMVGTPQLGTPKAIASLLHGTDQGFSVLNNFVPVLSEDVAREIATNMPGAYGLLPGQRYLNETGEPVIQFAPGASTDEFISVFGDEISSQTKLDDFLNSLENGRDEVDTLDEAAVANSQILSGARQTRARTDAWEAPADVEVHTIVGTGRNTIAGIVYESFSERICTLLFFCQQVELYKPVPQISLAGDETVMVQSAAWQPDTDTKQWFVDLNEIEARTEQVFQHANMTEALVIQQLVSDILLATSTEIQFVSEEFDLSEDSQVMVGAHSPVYMYIEDNAGRQTGQLGSETVVEEIPNTQFLTLGDSSYILAPTDLEFTIYVNAYDEGGLTVTLHSVERDKQSLIHKIPVTLITGSSTITAQYSEQVLSSLLIDVDGDTVLDSEVLSDGTVIELIVEPESPVISSEPQSNRGGVRVSRPEAQVAGVVVSIPNTSVLTGAEIQQLLTKIMNRLLELQNTYE